MTAETQKNLRAIKARLEKIKKESGEIKMILPLSAGKNIKRDFNKAIKILDEMLEE